MEQLESLVKHSYIKPLADNVFLIAPSKRRYLTTNSLLLYNERETVLIDTGAQNKIDQLATIKNHIEINTIFYTHFHIDHVIGTHLFPGVTNKFIHYIEVPALSSLHNYVDFTIGESATESDYLLFKKRFITLMEKEQITNWSFLNLTGTRPIDFDTYPIDDNLKLFVLSTPGHSPGHCSFFEESSGILFLGDLGFTPFGPWYGYPNCNINDFIDTTDRLLAFVKNKNVKVGVPSHSPIITGKSTLIDSLKLIKEKISLRDKKIITFIGEQGPIDLKGLVQQSLIFNNRLGRPIEVWEYFERVHLIKHLERLIKNNKINYDGSKYYL